jgi:hypothetical protein
VGGAGAARGGAGAVGDVEGRGGGDAAACGRDITEIIWGRERVMFAKSVIVRVAYFINIKRTYEKENR